MTSRQEWYKKRLDQCLSELRKLNKTANWKEFIPKAHELATELLHATTEWEKCYYHLDK